MAAIDTNHQKGPTAEAKLERLHTLLNKIGSTEVAFAVAFKAPGFAYVALDLQGYRTSSLNEVFEK